MANYFEFRCTNPKCGVVEERYKSAKYCYYCKAPLERVTPRPVVERKKRKEKKSGEVILSAEFGPLMESITELVEYVSSCATRIGDFLANDILPELRKVYVSFSESAYKAYLAQGAPYGEGTEGMLIWLKELCERKGVEVEDGG